VGPYNKRASSLIYLSWVQQAGGSVKGQSAVPPKDEQLVVVPLFLLKQSNEEQMDRLHALLRKAPVSIHWYLEQADHTYCDYGSTYYDYPHCAKRASSS
jgi:hypothetical protein